MPIVYFCKNIHTFLSSSLKEGMLRQTNISEALLYFGMPNSFRKLLLYKGFWGKCTPKRDKLTISRKMYTDVQ